MVIKKLYEYYVKVFSRYPIELEKAIGECRSLLDVGCGNSSPVKSFSRKFYSVGVDAHEPSIKKSKKAKIHNKYYRMNVLDIRKNFRPNSFDCVLASDVIEHLTKKDGIKLLEIMEKIASKKVIVFTPNGFLAQGEYDGNPWQVHKSGWDIQEMKNRGYKVIGINGWKPLRGEYALVKFWPSYFWILVSDITQLFVRNIPKGAFQILCIKSKE